MVDELHPRALGMELDHLGKVFPDILEGNVFEFSAALGTGMIVQFDVHFLAFAANAREHTIFKDMLFDVAEIKVLVYTDHLLGHRVGIIAKVSCTRNAHPRARTYLFFDG